MRRLLLVALVLLLGCGRFAPPPPGSAHTEDLVEIGALVTCATADRGRPPAGLADVEPYALGFPSALDAIKKGECVVFWGVRVEPGGRAVLAYEAAAPRSGGVVLLLDGRTVKRLTAEEFRVAPKAGE